MTNTISIIIPTLNEEDGIGKTLAPLLESDVLEIILVDGGSSDKTVSIAEKVGCRIIVGSQGRGKQMNAGAVASTGELLLFLHADTLLPPNFLQLIRETLGRPEVIAGAFSLGFDDKAKSLAFIAWWANLRSRFLQLPYGDQALFVRRDSFDVAGAFPEIEIMEDFVFIRRLSKLGKIVILGEKVSTSSRRWQNIGLVKTSIINQIIVCGHLLRVPSHILAKLYQRMRGIGK